MISQSVQTAAGADRDGEDKRGCIPFYVRSFDRQECHDEDSEAEAECWKPGRAVVSLLASLCDGHVRAETEPAAVISLTTADLITYLSSKKENGRGRVARRQYARLCDTLLETDNTRVPLAVCFSGILISSEEENTLFLIIAVKRQRIKRIYRECLRI